MVREPDGAGAVSVETTHRRITRLMVARLVLCLGVFAVALVFVGAGQEGAERVERGLYGTIGFSFLVTLVYAGVLRFIRSLTRFGAVQLATDIGIVTSLVFFSGGADSIFSFLYLPITVYGAVLFDRRGAYGTAVLASAGYGVVLLAAEPIEMASVLGGMASLGALVALRKRLPPGKIGEPEEMPPAHFPLLANLGAMLFGLGLLGWSLSTPFHAAGATLNLPRIAVNIVLAGAGATFVTQTYSWFAIGRANALMSARGAAAGFIAIAAGAPFIPPWAALLVGAVVGLLLPLSVYFVERVLRLPDATATIALGLVAGLIGLLVVPIFADGLWGQGWNGVGLEEYQTEALKGVTGFLPAEKFENGDGPGQLIAQLAGLGAIGLLSFFIGWLTFTLLNLPYTRPWEQWGK